MNKMKVYGECFAISISNRLANDYAQDNAANCWLKNGSDAIRDLTGVTTAILKV